VLTDANGRPTWRDLTEAVNGLRSEMQNGFERLEQRLRWTVGTVIAAAGVAVAIILGANT
jgi:hypothetical protein